MAFQGGVETLRELQTMYDFYRGFTGNDLVHLSFNIAIVYIFIWLFAFPP